ncbi:MAG: rhodanese-like domain-containing protein [Anaerolineae bacterium]
MRKGILSIVGVLLTLLLVACGGSQQQPAPQQSRGDAQTTGGLPQGQPVKTAKGTYFNIDVNQLKPLLEGDSVFTVNVHIPYAGDIPGTDASIPFNQVAQHLDALPADKDAPVVVYCRSGNMSAQASETLADLGYTRIFNVTGGMNAWKQAGNQLVQQ